MGSIGEEVSFEEHVTTTGNDDAVARAASCKRRRRNIGLTGLAVLLALVAGILVWQVGPGRDKKDENGDTVSLLSEPEASPPSEVPSAIPSGLPTQDLALPSAIPSAPPTQDLPLADATTAPMTPVTTAPVTSTPTGQATSGQATTLSPTSSSRSVSPPPTAPPTRAPIATEDPTSSPVSPPPTTQPTTAPVATEDPTSSPVSPPPTAQPTTAPVATEDPTSSPVSPPPTAQPTLAPVDPAIESRLCNGLASNCNRRVNEIMYATVHNAHSTRDDGFSGYNNLLPLDRALEAGYRGLMLDSCDCGDIVLCHEACFWGERDSATVSNEILDFMENNVNEVVIIELQVNDGSFQGWWGIVSQDDRFLSLLYNHPGPGTEWPTLGELVDFGQRLILFQHDGPNCGVAGACPVGVHPTFSYMFETPYDSQGADELLDTSRTCVASRGGTNAQFFISNHFARAEGWLEIPSESIAREVNAQENLQARLDACHSILGRNTNLLAVDFWSVAVDDMMQVVNAHNAGLP